MAKFTSQDAQKILTENGFRFKPNTCTWTKGAIEFSEAHLFFAPEGIIGWLAGQGLIRRIERLRLPGERVVTI